MARGELVVNGGGHETRREAGTPTNGPRGKKSESKRRSERRPPGMPGALVRRRGRALEFGRRGRYRRLRLRRLADFERIDVDRLGDVLELGRAEIADRHLEPSLDLPVCVLREADRARLGDALEPRGDIDAVAHEVTVALLDHVAQVNSDAKFDAPFRRQAGVALDHAVLHFDRAAHGVDHAAELDDRAVAGALDDVAVMHRDDGIDEIAAKGSQAREDKVLVRACETAVSDDVGDRIAASFRVSLIAPSGEPEDWHKNYKRNFETIRENRGGQH